MSERQATVVVIGTSRKHFVSERMEIKRESPQIYPGWDIVFYSFESFGMAAQKLAELENVELLYVVNDSDFSLEACEHGAQLIADALKAHHPQAIVGFSMRLLRDVIHRSSEAPKIDYKIDTFWGGLPDALRARWMKRPSTPKLSLVA